MEQREHCCCVVPICITGNDATKEIEIAILWVRSLKINRLKVNTISSVNARKETPTPQVNPLEQYVPITVVALGVKMVNVTFGL
jgi:hypothetical protein